VTSYGMINGCISFVCPGCAEHVLANEVVRNTARTNRTVCGVYHVLRWCRRNQVGGTDYLFFYIECFYTLLIFLKLRNTKEMRGFFRGRRDFVNCEYSPL
jgi:hypothetical protein